MKKIMILLFGFSLLTINAQFKEELSKPVDVRSGITNNQPSSFFTDFFNSADITMKHSFSLSYSAFGNQGVSLGVYTNTLGIKFSDNLNLEVDASLINSPYNTLGEKFTDGINGLYISRAELNYKIADNMHLELQYFHAPVMMTGYYGYRPSFWR